VHRIRANARRIVGILITASQTIDALSHQHCQLVIDLALLAEITKTYAQTLDQTIAKAPIGGREQDRSTIAAAMRLIKRQHYRTLFMISKQYTLCRSKISQAKVLLCCKYCLVNTFVAHKAFAAYRFVHYSG
jgi:hypothetical protein